LDELGTNGKIQRKWGMGFRDLVIFNKALLAKQLWRIFQNSDSLVARILKAKYYPHGSIMDAIMGRRLFYAWRSIISAKSVIDHGTI
jgi:hypothetical protein